MSKAIVTARVQVTVEFVVGTWEDSVRFDDLRNLAKREGLKTIQNRMAEQRLRIIGEPIFSAVTAGETP